jgi:phage tail-like protein
MDAYGLQIWLDEVRAGSREVFKAVTINLLSEDRKNVMTWKLSNAWPLKYTGPSPDGKGNALAIEELVLAAESIKLLSC